MRLDEIITRSPPYHKDRLFSDLQKYTCSPRATQLLPDYKEFRLGHGDPLMQAVMKHWIDMLHIRKKVVIQKEEDLGFKDVVHLVKDTITSFPCLPMGGDKEEENPQEPKKLDVDHLQEHGSPLCGLGLNDIVHIDKDTVINIPCLPSLEQE
jgi:hypothetical protein